MDIINRLNAASEQDNPVDNFEDRLRMELSIAIQNGLAKKKLSISELSDASNVTHQHLLRILHDEANPTFRTVAKIASALECYPFLTFKELQPHNYSSEILEVGFGVESNIAHRVRREASWKTPGFVSQSEMSFGDLAIEFMPHGPNRTA